MRTEIEFIRHNLGFWNELFPYGKDYIKEMNAVLVTQAYEEIVAIEDSDRRAFINVAAFKLFELHAGENRRPDVIDSLDVNDAQLQKVILRARDYMLNAFGQEIPDTTLSATEFEIIKTQGRRLLDKYGGKPGLVVQPEFAGCGILNRCAGDVYYKDTLVEVKAGTRPFGITELRQLFTYAALNHVSNPESRISISRLELFNPRTGQAWAGDMDGVSLQIAGAEASKVLDIIVRAFVNYI